MISHKFINHNREIFISRLSIAVSLVLFFLMFNFLLGQAHVAYAAGKTKAFIEAVVFCVAMFFTAYGNLVYQICLVGYYKRRKKHVPASRSEILKLYTKAAPSLSVLIPSYKEESRVVSQTLLSAALAEYPKKNIVLLIDDPYKVSSLEDMIKLEEARRLPVALQAMFDKPFARFSEEKAAFEERKRTGNMHYALELNRLSMLYEEVAAWLENVAHEFAGGKEIGALYYSEKFFVENILLGPAQKYHALAEELRGKMKQDAAEEADFLDQHYARLVALFHVRFSSFERKKYSNLSHEANKAMNLNSYIALIGKSWKEVEVNGALELHEVAPEEADLTIEKADYINTIDADSFMLPDYLIRMVEVMERPENGNLAVVQSSVSSIPHSPNILERTVGICLDLQFMNHQGFTHWNATFWVGANALLRYRALEDIKEVREEEGKKVVYYIKDRTVIEDTESTVDLVEKGWQLYNYPERLSYSVMPADFGSLLIQRRRWANGGMIILPKLLRYVAKAPKNLELLKEFSMRFHYLAATTTGCMVIALLSAYKFGDNVSTLWIMLSALPCALLYIRTLVISGYKPSDILRVAAVNLMLVPVLFGGVIKQFQQIVTGKKIPFSRTPKVPGRTAAPALYCAIEIALAIGCSTLFINDVLERNWVKAIFSSMNAAFMIYALVRFMGVKETLQDMFASVVAQWKAVFYHAEILPFYAASRRARSYIMPLRKQA